MAASPDLLLAVALCLLLRLAGHAQPFERHPVLASFFRVDAVYLDSVLETLSLPAHLDPVLGVVQSSILDERRWPLRFSALSEHLPLLRSTWCAVYNCALSLGARPLATLLASCVVYVEPKQGHALHAPRACGLRLDVAQSRRCLLSGTLCRASVSRHPPTLRKQWCAMVFMT